ncbi:amino acid deaminase [Pseudoroseicyclus tamaricis]|uniref:Amino acid deaminase n=1 Tax=Pseudoroseicyclus tamaricis TaxID=2705421 RepID=A0A6B2JNI9_9RHOB|nr:amino acid deaminase [Pseudoroseicyclus tamaricis]NDV00257.1 amino acid deaminase [Pseudoroseicyclus tamaricis]
MDLSEIYETVLDGRTKGLPGTAAPFALKHIAAQGWNVLREDMPLPLMVLKRAALDHNARVFGDYLSAHGLSLAPHGKTTMAPQLFAEQLRYSWAITAANVAQVQVMHRYGVDRVVLGNQLLGRAALASVAQMMAEREAFEFYVFVDSPAQLDNMARHLSGLGLPRPLHLLLEVGVAGGRTGLRTEEEAADLAEAMLAADPALFRFAGVASFEGVVPGLAEGPEPVRGYARQVVEIARALPPALYEGAEEFILTGGGSGHFDLMAEAFGELELPVPVRILLRSGCYVTTDNGGYKAMQEAGRADPHRSWKSELHPALEAWAYVQSMPEPGLAFLTMGKRDVPYDAGLPVPLKLYRPGKGFLPVGEAEVTAVNDQHAYVRLGNGAEWQVGDMVASGISHPCTAFDKWRFLPVVSDSYDVVDGVMTFF